MLMAGEKVLERSHRKAPNWLYAMEKGYIITHAEASTMEGAREEAFIQVKERVLTSIAENVRTDSRHNVNETIHNGEIESLSQFSKQIRTEGANIPYLSSISESKVQDYYWEKVQTSKTQIVYRYNIRYPLPEIEVRFLVKAFKEDQTRINSDIDNLRTQRLSDCGSIEQMAEVLSRAKGLMTELADSDPRKETCRTAVNALQNQLTNLHWIVTDHSQTEATLVLYMQEKPIDCNQRLTLRSNCYTQLKTISQGQETIINYNAEGCYPDEDNYVDVSFMVGTRKVSEKIKL